MRHGKKYFLLLWLATMVLQSILESKILRWKVKIEIYFPKWKVVSKVSVKPWPLPSQSVETPRSLSMLSRMFAAWLTCSQL